MKELEEQLADDQKRLGYLCATQNNKPKEFNICCVNGTLLCVYIPVNTGE